MRAARRGSKFRKTRFAFTARAKHIMFGGKTKNRRPLFSNCLMNEETE
jgi:hypothetical protein